ncbi:hypothetical protein NS230_26050 [Methylobacterium indicum]|uniref:GNAT family N-acetyltransferase n=1 Tax=Methylobacterium indicum TaxID=1775910 RepID=UPI0007DF7B31|nr:GNAT family N-acetyltransferase [Methylobacterium indicum]KTS44042.1 hypothetical protein NS230_26050 [Methylobacterium indicum]
MDVCSYTYRVLTAADGASWAALRREGARDFPLGFLITAEEADAMTPEKAQPILDQGMMRGVFDGSSLVGFCGFRRETLARTKHRAEIGPFFVTTAYQGRGAARTLMAGVINEAQVRGIEQLELFVDVGNHRALTFYERQGFKRISIHPDGVRIDGQVRDAYFCIIRPGEILSAYN